MSNIKIDQALKTPPGAGNWPLSGAGAGLGGVMRAEPEDFRVEEWRPEPLSGDGEHWVVRIEKRGHNTDHVAQTLARLCGVGREAVGFAGQKDRHAVTVQDFSIHLPGRGLPEGWAAALPEGVGVLEVGRHRRKIRPGHLAGNRFSIRLRDCAPRPDAARAVAERLLRHGAPNYFGPQRFGHEGGNVALGRALLAGIQVEGRRPTRHQRGMYLSAVRSELFNAVLAERIRAGWFQALLSGDVAMLAGRGACFRVEEVEAERPRFERGEIWPTGPLFGRKLMQPTGVPGEMEAAVAAEAGEVLAQLEGMGMEGERRALMMVPAGLTLTWEGRDVVFSFTLPKGGYATVVLREFMEGGEAGTSRNTVADFFE